MAPKKNAARIYFVEPDTFLGNIFKTKLELEGFAVQVVPTSKRLETLVARTVPEAIVVDFHAGALALIKKLRSVRETASVPVIVTSPYASRDDVARAQEVGTAAFIITTQVTPTEFIRQIRQVVAA